MSRLIRTSSDIGRLARAARLRHGLTQAEVADALGVTQKWISTVEGGKDTAPMGAVLRLLAWLGVGLSADAGEPRVSAGPQVISEQNSMAKTTVGSPRIETVLKAHRSTAASKRIGKHRMEVSGKASKRGRPSKKNDT